MNVTIESEGISISINVSNVPAQAIKTMMVDFADRILRMDKESEKYFSVKMNSCGMKKIEVIKQLRAMFDLPLKEAKDMSEKVDSVILVTPSLDEAMKVTRSLQGVGASVELIPQ